MSFRYWIRSLNLRPNTRTAPRRLRVERLDDRITPAAILATGADAGDAPTVTVYDTATQLQTFTINVYDASFTGGVNTAVGDLTGDGVPDIVTGPGAGGGPDVRVYSGTDGSLVASLSVGDSTSTAGATVAVADFDADGIGDLVLGGVQSGFALVQVVRLSDRAILQQFSPGTGSAAPWVAAGDVTGDGTPDVVIGSGQGNAPRVIVYDSSTGQVVVDRNSFEETFTGGVRVTTGDLDADGRADVITAAGFLGGPRVQVFSGGTQAVLQNFFAYDSTQRAGVWAVAVDTNGDGTLDLLTTNGSGQSADPRSFSATDLSSLAAPNMARAPAAASFDVSAPTATVFASATASQTGPLSFTIAFSEPVNGFSQAGVAVTNGAIASFTKLDGKTYSVVVTPSAEGDVTVAVAAAAAFDAAGNANAVSAVATSRLDSTAPVVAANALVAASTTPTLTGTVDDSTATVFVSVGGQTITATVSGTIWTAVVPTPLGEGQIDVAVSATDAAGNVGTATGTLTIDITAPDVAVASDADESTTIIPIPFTVTFSEPVNGFTADDVDVENGTVFGFVTVDGATYTVTVVPTGPGTVTVIVPAGVATDEAGVGNSASEPVSRAFTGSVVTATVTVADSSPTAAETLTFTVTFSDDVTNFNAGILVATNGTVASIIPIDARTYSVTVTPTADGTVTLAAPAGTATDSTGSPTAGGASASVVSDRTGPIPTVTATTSLTNANPVTYTVVLDEDVTDFTAEDLTVSNGTVASVAATNARTYTVTVTPAADGAIDLGVVAGAVTDSLGNSSPASNVVSIQYDSTPPTATVTASDVTGTGPMTFTVTFDEPVNGLSASGLIVTNGTAGTVTTVTSSVYTVQVTPSGDGLVTLTVPAASTSDTAGNATTADAIGSATVSGSTTNSAGLSTTIPSLTADGWTTLADGLRIRDVTTGTGDTITSTNQSITVHYTGWLKDGTEFDSSASGSAVTFTLSGLIEGWQEGLIGMKVGGVRDLDIPSDLGYGDSATGSIPAGSDLVFEIKLISVSG